MKPRIITLTPDDLFTADDRADEEQRLYIRMAPKTFGRAVPVRKILELLDRGDELPQGSHVESVYKDHLGVVTVHVIDANPFDEEKP